MPHDIDNLLDFDPVAHTQGGLPHLLAHLWAEYSAFLLQTIAERGRRGQQTLGHAEALAKAPAQSFLTWAVAYLGKYRPVETFPLDANVGVRLSNNQQVSICPGIDLRGTMQESNVAISISEDRAGRRAIDTGSIGI